MADEWKKMLIHMADLGIFVGIRYFCLCTTQITTNGGKRLYTVSFQCIIKADTLYMFGIYEGMTMMDNVEEKWINIDEAAEYFGVKPATIRDWIRRGKNIPAQKIGKAWKFKYSELDAWAKSQDSAINK